MLFPVLHLVVVAVPPLFLSLLRLMFTRVPFVIRSLLLFPRLRPRLFLVFVSASFCFYVSFVLSLLFVFPCFRSSFFFYSPSSPSSISPAGMRGTNKKRQKQIRETTKKEEQHNDHNRNNKKIDKLIN